jgi:predicted SAM-dependent methyltransferase
MIIRDNCVSCCSKIENIYTKHNFPIKFSVENNINNFQTKKLSFSFCKKCNIIQLDKLIELDILYSNGHNFSIVGNTWKMFFEFFNDIINKYLTNKNILEIGCPSGKLALSNKLYNNWYIVDPNVINIKNNKNIHAINQFFDNNFTINNKIDIIIHSHLFEHIYNPIEFLRKCYDILCINGIMIFAIPNMEDIINNNIAPFGGVMFEHNIFYSKKTIVNMLQKVNFKIINIHEYKNHSLIFEMKKTDEKFSNITIKDDTNYLQQFYKNINYYEEFVESCLNNIKGEQNIYIFGASYNTQILLYMGLDKLNINGILDNCLEKHNNYLYGFNIKIDSPNILVDNNCIVILKNGHYSNEIKKQILELNKNTIIIE